MYEHFGGEYYIRTLICNKLNGIAGVQSTLKTLGYSEKFNEIFRNWTIANYLDNKNIAKGEYYHNHYNFMGCKMRKIIDSLPIVYSDSLKAYSSHYIRISGNSDSVYLLSVSGDKTSDFRASLIYSDTTNKNNSVVKHVNVGKEIVAGYIIDKNKQYYNELILVVMNTDTNLVVGKFAGYKVTFENYEYPDNVDEISVKGIKTDFNEDKLLINLGTLTSKDCIVELFDINGHLIDCDKSSLSERKIDMSGNAPGLYILRIKCGNSIFFQKILYY
jgi:hypothetical protein